jgi:hypothetical protein
MGRLRGLVAKLRRDARGEFDCFTLKDGSTYRYDRMQAMGDLYLYAYDYELGRDPEPPEIWVKLLEARDPERALAPFRATNPERAFISCDKIYREQTGESDGTA